MGHHRRRKSRGRVWSMAVLAEGLIALLLLVAFTLTIASPPEPAAEPDLDADSDNNDGASPPSRSAYEDAIEDVAGNPAFPGKFIQVNDNDDDGDGVVDFADGFNWDMDRWGWGAVPNPNDNLTGGQGPGDFVPIVLELPEGLDPTDSTILLIYNASQPGVYWAAAGELMPGYPPYGAEEWWGVSGHTWDHSCAPSALGSLRLWLAPERAPRHPVWLVDPTTYPIDWRGYPWDFYELPPGQPLPQGAYVAPGLYFASQLGFSPAIRTITLYAEAVQTSTALAAERIEVYVGPPDWDGTPDCLTPMDAVRLTAVGLDLAFTPGWPAFYEAGDDQVEDAAEGFFDSFGVWKRFPVNWLPVNEMDIDGDGVPNFADGYDLDGVAGNADDRNDVQSPREHECGGCLDLTIHDPLWELPSLANEGVVTFTYAASDPAAVAYDPATRRYTPAPGRLRIWIKHSFVTADQPGDRSPRSPRSVADPLQPGHFIPTGVPVKLAALGLSPENPSVALFLEGIAPSPSYRGDSIEVVLDPDGPGPLPAVCRDRLRVTVVRTSPDLDVDSDNDSPDGTPSRSEAEEALEDTPPGKLINVNDDDDDADGVPDGEDFDNPNEDDFVPMILELPEHTGFSTWYTGFFISLDYDHARLRVWTKPGNVPRDPRPYWIWDEEWQTYHRGGDVVEPLGRGLEWPEWVLKNGYWRPAGPPLTLYVEALASSAEPGDARIAVRTFNYTYYITTSLGSDAVRFTAVGKKVDLDTDSDNTNGLEPPDRSEAEDEIEDTAGDPERPGKFIQVNDGDRDGDGIPDYFDGFDGNGTPGDEDDGCEGGRFVPIVIELLAPPGPEARLRFTYSASAPAAVIWDSETGAYSFPEGDTGKLRLWRADASSARRKAPVTEDGDFIPSGVDIPASCLPFLGGKTATLYIEAIRASEGTADCRIEVELDPGSYAEPVKDAVRCTVASFDVKLYECGEECPARLYPRDEALSKHGVPVYLNNDDDTGDGVEDNRQLRGKRDPGNALSMDEDNLHFFKVRMEPGTAPAGAGASGLAVFLRLRPYDPAKPAVRLWKSPTKDESENAPAGESQLIALDADGEKSWPLAEFMENIHGRDLWVEGVEQTGTPFWVQCGLRRQTPAASVDMGASGIRVRVDPMPIRPVFAPLSEQGEGVRFESPPVVPRFQKIEIDLEVSNEYFHWNRLAPPLAAEGGAMGQEGMTFEDLFDAYDADADRNMIEVNAVFRLLEDGRPTDRHRFDVPCFVMKKAAEGPWVWKVRFAPPKAGTWQCDVSGRSRHTAAVGRGPSPDTPRHKRVEDGVEFYEHAKSGIEALPKDQFPTATIRFQCENSVGGKAYPGPLQSGAQLGNRETNAYREAWENLSNRSLWRTHKGTDAAPSAVFCPGWARPWNIFNGAALNPDADVRRRDAPWGTEYIDRNAEVYSQLHDTPYIFAQWMAPWGLMLTHQPEGAGEARVYKEKWENAASPYKFDWWALPGDLNKAVTDRPWAYYDQGRASSLDQIIEKFEEKGACVLLTLWPHAAFTTGADNGWDKQNGFRGCEGQPAAMSFFQAESGAEDWRGRYWLHQKTLHRYIVARWSYSRALGVWETISEIDGIGAGKYESIDPAVAQWHSRLVADLRSLDPFKHPITVSTTAADRLNNPKAPYPGEGTDAVVDILSFHTYPVIPKHLQKGRPREGRKVNDKPGPWVRNRTNLAELLGIQAEAIHKWAARARTVPKPYIVGEFGAYERNPGEAWNANGATPPACIYPNCMHYGAWASFAAGSATSALEWNDGKEFGEMRTRPPDTDPFKDYPFNNLMEIDALRRFVTEPGSPVDLAAGFSLSEAAAEHDPNTQAIASTCGGARNGQVAGILWVYNKIAQAHLPTVELNVAGLKPGATYAVRWYNTWTGAPITQWRQAGRASLDGTLTVRLSHDDMAKSRPADDDPARQYKLSANDIVCKMRKEADQ